MDTEYRTLLLIATIVVIATAIAISLPHDTADADDDNAYLSYTITDITKDKRYTYVSYTVVNHGYSDCTLYGYNFEYVTQQPKDNIMRPYVNSPINLIVQKMSDGDVFSVTATFDTTDTGDAGMFSSKYHIREN